MRLQFVTLKRAILVTTATLAADWTWWAYGRAIAARAGLIRVYPEVGEDLTQVLLIESEWRLSVTMVSGLLGLFASYFLLLELENEPVFPGRFASIRLYFGAMIIVMLCRVLFGMMLLE